MNKQRCFAKINIDNLIHNFNVVKTLCPDCRIMPVIKADAYSHGAVKIAKALVDRADIFAVAEIEEAKQLRRAGIDSDILILGYTDPACANELVCENFIQTVMSLEYANALSNNLNGKKLKIHIKIDTGMHRFGFDWENENTICEIKEIAENPRFILDGMFTHFSESDNLASSFTLNQEKRFEKVIDSLLDKGIKIPYLHSANSAGVLSHSFSRMNMVRPGIILYGAYPSENVKKAHLTSHPDLPLKEVMTMCARVGQIKTIKKGEGIGYSLTHTFEKNSTVAVVSAGYADGIPRALSNKGEATINGIRFSIAGSVCMDLLMLDITGYEDRIKVGDEVHFWGNDSISVDEYAKLCDTINYTVYTGVSKRVEKIYE